MLAVRTDLGRLTPVKKIKIKIKMLSLLEGSSVHDQSQLSFYEATGVGEGLLSRSRFGAGRAINPSQIHPTPAISCLICSN